MISDEDAVRTLLRESDIPPTGLDVGLLMADSRRSRRRRRVATVAGAVLSVVAVAVPAAVVANRVTRPEPPAGDFATTTRLVHRKTKVGAATQCQETPFRSPMAGSYAVQDVDATGERVVGSREGATTLTLWTRGEPTQFDWPNMRANEASVIAVNSGGTVVGYDRADPAISYIYRDGAVRTLTKPDDYRQAHVVDVNERGDAVGTLTSPANDLKTALVIWPAGHPDQPRVVPEPNLQPLAIRDDGTVIALRLLNVNRPHERGDAVVIYRPDGTRLQIDGPPGLTRAAVVRGDLLFTTVETGEHVAPLPDQPDPGPYPVDRPVRWNLRTGLVEIFDDLIGGFEVEAAANSSGWFLAATQVQTVASAIVAPDGSVRNLPPYGWVNWISANGSVRIGPSPDGTIVTWRCQRPAR